MKVDTANMSAAEYGTIWKFDFRHFALCEIVRKSFVVFCPKTSIFCIEGEFVMLDIKITKTTTPKAKPDESKLGFGKIFSDHMFLMD